MKILVLDNYDSFTYNLVHLVYELGYQNLAVYRNDKITLTQAQGYDKILLSPGPGIPNEAGIMLELVNKLAPQKSILGICLGHQAICEVFGAKLFNMQLVTHGLSIPTIISNKQEPLFQGLPQKFFTGRYHSWSVDKESLPQELKVTAVSADGTVMGVSHEKFDTKGLQFHPESILTQHGKIILQNWLQS